MSDCNYIICGPDYDSMADEEFEKYAIVELKDILGLISNKKPNYVLYEDWLIKLVTILDNRTKLKWKNE